MAVTIDIGDPKDHHPTNKQEVGRRLALAALKDVYGLKVRASGPVLDGAKREGTDFRLHFRVADGLKLKGDSDRVPDRRREPRVCARPGACRGQ